MKSIDEHIQKDQSEIESAKAEGNLPKVRHLTEVIKPISPVCIFLTKSPIFICPPMVSLGNS